ncbi:39S ribosomal protein L55, mitochondrial-like isoform X1 [Centruroides sculpturatus]|uniref:39S ribosomal protein L55, mitochondrial-like isoform X1 n=2 Tax=Centruroides sculpturatus TaxID=218467 RepID=UPI000C6E10BA|nr:39S ribosomal protein L55, mitochondrial-like isoform X1 [Centruroides sculpturatus]
MALFRRMHKSFGIYFQKFSIGNQCFNSNRASITKVRRKIYAKMYPAVLVQPDGSTINIRYHEPKMIIKLPPDLDKMSEEEKRKYMNKQKPKEKVVLDSEIDDTFDVNQYSHLWKKK